MRHQQQSIPSAVTLETEDANSVQLNQLINFQNFNSTGSLPNDDASNEIDTQVKILKQQIQESHQSSKNLKSVILSSAEQSNNKQSTQQQVKESMATNYQPNFNPPKSNSKFDQQTNLPVQHDQNQINQNGYQQQPNRLFCSHGVMQNNGNNMIRHLFNNNQNPNATAQLQANNNLNDVLQQNNASNFFNHQSNGAIYHYHHPTIYHVTTKDPNLNSTLNSPIADATCTNGNNFNGHMNATNHLNNNAGLQNLNHLNFNNNNFANNLCNSANQLILTNQLLLQHQQLYHQQMAQQHSQNDMNSLGVFLPQVEQNNNSSFHQYNAPQTQFLFDDIMSEAERQQNNFFSPGQTNQQVNKTNKLFTTRN